MESPGVSTFVLVGDGQELRAGAGVKVSHEHIPRHLGQIVRRFYFDIKWYNVYAAMLIRQLTTVLNRAMSTSISTEARWASATEVFTGPFAITRALLDYKWHSHYIPERQAVQDTIISKLLCGGVRVEKPWLIYTAGPMGAGEKHEPRSIVC